MAAKRIIKGGFVPLENGTVMGLFIVEYPYTHREVSDLERASKALATKETGRVGFIQMQISALGDTQCLVVKPSKPNLERKTFEALAAQIFPGAELVTEWACDVNDLPPMLAILGRSALGRR